jgi:FkbM family methyltransferase
MTASAPDYIFESVTCQTPYGMMLMPAHCQVITPAVQRTGGWAAEECNLLSALLRPGDTFIDFGAHVGYLTVAGALAVGKQGSVICFEANPGNADMLRRNCLNLDLPQVEVIEAAAWSEARSGEMSIARKNAGAGCAYQHDGIHHNDSALIEFVRCGDVLADKLTRLDVIKMDVQGSEAHVVKGMYELLEKYRPRILMEFAPKALTASGLSAADLLSDLRSLHYEIRIPGIYNLNDIPALMLMEIAADTVDGEINILAMPKQA